MITRVHAGWQTPLCPHPLTPFTTTFTIGFLFVAHKRLDTCLTVWQTQHLLSDQTSHPFPPSRGGAPPILLRSVAVWRRRPAGEEDVIKRAAKGVGF